MLSTPIVFFGLSYLHGMYLQDKNPVYRASIRAITILSRLAFKEQTKAWEKKYNLKEATPLIINTLGTTLIYTAFLASSVALGIINSPQMLCFYGIEPIVSILYNLYHTGTAFWAGNLPFNDRIKLQIDQKTKELTLLNSLKSVYEQQLNIPELSEKFTKKVKKYTDRIEALTKSLEGLHQQIPNPV